MPALISPQRADLGYAIERLQISDPPVAPQVRGTIDSILAWRASRGLQPDDPWREHLWVADVRVLWPRVSLVFWSLRERGSCEVVLQGDPVPFTHLFLSREVSDRLGLPFAASRHPDREYLAHDLLAASPHGWDDPPRAFLAAHPLARIQLQRSEVDLGDGWWRAVVMFTQPPST